VGDFNNDNNLDVAALVVGDTGASTLTVNLGDQLGFFYGNHHDTGVGYHATALAVGNFNNDNNLDVIVVTNSGSVALVLLGNGDGTFSRRSKTVIGAGESVGGQSVAVGDFNGDRKLDAVVVGPRGTQVLLGNGSGGFVSVRTVGPAADSVAVADVNLDGKLDIVSGGDGVVQVQLGNGDGTFQAPANFAIPSGPNGSVLAASLALADLNGDGQLDVVTGTFDPGAGNGSYQTDVLLGNGDGTFEAAQAVGPGGRSVGVADFNHDGKLDIVSVGETASYVELGNGDGTFADPLNVLPDGGYAAVGDFNLDGYPDLALGLVVYLNDQQW
jgi:hypothetical protein